MPRSFLKSQDLYVLFRVMTKPCYGYQICQESPEKNSSGIYYRLHKLTRRGLLEYQKVEQENAPSYLLYSVTKKGESAFYSTLEAEEEVLSQFNNKFEILRLLKPNLPIYNQGHR